MRGEYYSAELESKINKLAEVCAIYKEINQMGRELSMDRKDNQSIPISQTIVKTRFNKCV